MPPKTTNSTSSQPQETNDIWTLIETKYNDSNANGNESKKQQVIETNILFLGNASSGKTSLLHHVLLRNSNIPQEPSIALEYTYGRKEDGYKLFIAHFWELAGGTSLLSLSDEIANAQNIHSLTAVICLDMTKPLALIQEFFSFIHHLEKHTQESFQVMKSHGSNLPGKMIERAKKRFGSSHEDIDQVHFIGIPIIIVATKYDQFQEMFSPQHVKIMSQTLRYLAHIHGSSIIQMDLKNESSNPYQHKAFRQIMNNIMFSGPLGNEAKQSKTDSTRGAICVFSGNDSLKSIGPPALKSSGSSGNASPIFDNILKIHPYIQADYIHTFASVFNLGKISLSQVSSGLGTLKLDSYPEPIVDEMRKQKDEELATLRAEIRRSEQQARQRKVLQNKES